MIELQRQGDETKTMFFDDNDWDVTPPRRRRFFTSRRAVLARRDENGQRLVEEVPGERREEESEADYFPAPEDFAPAPPKVRGPLSQAPAIEHMRPAFLMFALFFVASFIHWAHPDDSPLSASATEVFKQGEWWRLVTALFTHADIAHLASNTPLFLIFGWFLAAYFGRLVFPIAALVVGVLSNLATIATYSPNQSLVGASGMLYGMVALWLVLYVKFDTDYSVPKRVFRAIGVSLLLLFPTTFQQTTSYTAHAAGFAIGLVVGWVMTFFVQVRPQVR